MNAGEHPSTRAGARTGTSAECSKILFLEAEKMYHSDAADNKTIPTRTPPVIFNASKTPLFPLRHELAGFPNQRILKNFISSIQIFQPKMAYFSHFQFFVRQLFSPSVLSLVPRIINGAMERSQLYFFKRGFSIY
ncbi:hypothetical protein [Akkermansia muciniphila]|uniref:hypothetical protein n=1 Tax=Akkermansia muciniphila TaxID=239935 RepID=UPI0015E0649C|nr:hypothetical protein [Akkermansia muciniphila]